jgi:hypothetical protein
MGYIFPYFPVVTAEYMKGKEFLIEIQREGS